MSVALMRDIAMRSWVSGWGMVKDSSGVWMLRRTPFSFRDYPEPWEGVRMEGGKRSGLGVRDQGKAEQQDPGQRVRDPEGRVRVRQREGMTAMNLAERINDMGFAIIGTGLSGDASHGMARDVHRAFWEAGKAGKPVASVGPIRLVLGEDGQGNPVALPLVENITYRLEKWGGVSRAEAVHKVSCLAQASYTAGTKQRAGTTG